LGSELTPVVAAATIGSGDKTPIKPSITDTTGRENHKSDNDMIDEFDDKEVKIRFTKPNDASGKKNAFVFGSEVEKGNLLCKSGRWKQDTVFNSEMKKAKKNKPLSVSQFHRFGITS
jgi:hypothetical protein